MAINLFDHQKEALLKMKNGCILCGGVGSGKSITSIAYYYTQQGYKLSDPNPKHYKTIVPQDLYIITTARKRDTREWDGELTHFLLSTEKNIHGNKVVVDSWNNIGKYENVYDAFFIFDEQRVVGKGAWVKSFLKITKRNSWILLSATPGDTWLDYIPVFIANGFYRNRTEFNDEHIIWRRFTKFPQVEKFYNTGRLIRLRDSILVDMDFNRQTESHHIDIYCEYDNIEYKKICKDRWNPIKNEPIVNASELCYELRRCVNSDWRRSSEVMEIVKKKGRAIIFYNFDYELEILKTLAYFDPDGGMDISIAEWNGHKHEPVPDSKYWVYLVQYNAGAEGWNCIKTDTIIFYSQNYSYKIMVQSSGRIDRLNTPFHDLYYYHLKSRSGIDLAISKALKEKKKFNESKFVSFKN